MSTTPISRTTSSTGRPGPTLGPLARQEMKAYARHPLFLVGLLVTVASMVLKTTGSVESFSSPSKHTSSLFETLLPALLVGVFGIFVMSGLVRRSDRAHAAAGATAVSERTRTAALASAALVPFAVGLVWFGWAVWTYHDQPPSPGTMPFGPAGDGWAYGMLLALGGICTLGGPILGLVIGRWLPFRGAAILTAVVVVLGTIVLQGIVEPLRYGRVFWPWTQFGGPVGIDGDPERFVLLTGSPQWYCLYLVALCALGVVAALLHDQELPRDGLVRIGAAVLAVALALGSLAMTQGLQEEHVNPLPNPTVTES